MQRCLLKSHETSIAGQWIAPDRIVPKLPSVRCSRRGCARIRRLCFRAAATHLLSAERAESVIAPNNRGHVHDCANQTPPNAFRAPRSSARISAFRLGERDKGSRPRGALGRPSDSEMLALLLWIDAHDAFGRSPPSACSSPAGAFFHSLRFFLLDGERPMLHSTSSCFRREIARSRVSTTGW